MYCTEELELYSKKTVPVGIYLFAANIPICNIRVLEKT
jgi:hypothetical protein